MAHPARGPAVPRTAVSLHKHSTGHGRPSTPGSGLPAHAPQRCRGPRLPAPGEAYAAGSSGSRTNGQQGTPVCAAARGPVCAAADTRHGWTAPAGGWAARPCSAPLVGAHALERMLRLCPHLRPPGGAQGRHRRRCALPVRLLPLPPPSPHGDSAHRVDSCGAVWCTVPRS